jgi:hypothetical protein
MDHVAAERAERADGLNGLIDADGWIMTAGEKRASGERGSPPKKAS